MSEEELPVQKRPKNKTPVNGRSVAKNRKYPNPENEMQNSSDEGQVLTQRSRKQQPSEPIRRPPKKTGRARPLQSDESSNENPQPKKRRRHNQKSAMSPTREEVVNVEEDQHNQEELFKTDSTPVKKKKHGRVHSAEQEPAATTSKKHKKRKHLQQEQTIDVATTSKKERRHKGKADYAKELQSFLDDQDKVMKQLGRGNPK